MSIEDEAMELIAHVPVEERVELERRLLKRLHASEATRPRDTAFIANRVEPTVMMRSPYWSRVVSVLESTGIDIDQEIAATIARQCGARR